MAEDGDELLAIAASGVFAVLGEMLSEDEDRAPRKVVLPWRGRAEQAARVVLPQRLARYHEHLRQRIVEEEAPPKLFEVIPRAVNFAMALIGGAAGGNQKRWAKLVELVGIEDAEWLVTELLADTDMFAASQIHYALMAWAQAAYNTRLYPTCMEIEAREARAVRAPRRKGPRLR